jgi:hypothetical protein
MQRNKHKGRREGVGVALIAAFFVFLIFYLRFVSNHSEEIRRRQRAKQNEMPSSKARNLDNRHLIAEDEVEGGLGVEWDLLSRRRSERQTEDPRRASGAGDEEVSQHGKALNSAVVASTLEERPTLEHATAAVKVQMPSAKTEESRRVVGYHTTKQYIHTHPLSAGSRMLLTTGSSRAAAMSGHALLDHYDDIAENVADGTFFASEDHIFSHMPQFAKILRKWQTLNLEMRRGSRPPRFVTVHPVGQLCNRLMAVTSAALFAILTHRGLIVDDSGFYAQSSDLFEEPGFNWLDGGAHGGGVGGVGLGGHYITNPESGVWVDTEKLLCLDYAQAYPNAHVEMGINQYLVPYLTNNPHYREALLVMTGGSGDLFYPLSHFLFRPIRTIRQWRDQFVEEHFHGKFVVGLQARSGSDFTDHFMTPEDWRLYRDCAEAVVPPNDSREIVFFLATDTEEGRRKGTATLETSDLGLRHKVFVSTPTFLLSNHPEGVQKALLDILLLSACDDRVMTAWSSYGYFAAGFSGLDGNLVVDEPSGAVIAAPGQEQRFMGVPHKSDRRRQCVRLPTHQPCFHKFESWGASKSSCFTRDMFEREMMNGRYC